MQFSSHSASSNLKRKTATHETRCNVLLVKANENYKLQLLNLNIFMHANIECKQHMNI